MNKVSGVTLYLVGFLLLFFAFVLVRYECMLQFMCTRLVFIMFVAHVCVLVFDVSLFCVTSAKRGVRSLFSRSRVRAVRGAILLLLLPSRRTRRITFRLRIANRVGEDSRCRGRYCKHSVWLFSCASRTASSSQGALAVSCKYFKQSK